MSKGQVGAVILIVVAVYVATAAMFVVGEGERTLVSRFGAVNDVIDAPGLHFKAPFIDSTISFDARLMTVESPIEQVILGDQKRLEAQAYARFRVVDPLKLYSAAHSLDEAKLQLTRLVSSSLRRALGQATLRKLLSQDRAQVADGVRSDVAGRAAELGLEVTQVRLHRAELPLETSQAIYDRMKSERQREAKELRAQGFEWAQQIQAKADRARTGIVSDASRAAAIARGVGDAEAGRILAEAYGKDPKFYAFYRSLQTYRRSLADAAPVLVLSPDTEFLRVLKSGPGPAEGGFTP